MQSLFHNNNNLYNPGYNTTGYRYHFGPRRRFRRRRMRRRRMRRHRYGYPGYWNRMYYNRSPYVYGRLWQNNAQQAVSRSLLIGAGVAGAIGLVMFMRYTARK